MAFEGEINPSIPMVKPNRNTLILLVKNKTIFIKSLLLNYISPKMPQESFES